MSNLDDLMDPSPATEEPEAKKSRQQQITIQFHNENGYYNTLMWYKSNYFSKMLFLSGDAEFFPLSVPLSSSPGHLLSLVRQLIREKKAADGDEEEEEEDGDKESV